PPSLHVVPTRRPAQFIQDVPQRPRHTPTRVVRAELRQVRDVANVVADARLIDVFVVQRLADRLLDERDRFQHGYAVATPAAEVVDLAVARGAEKRLHGAAHVRGVQVVADLLALVAVNAVRPAFADAADQVRQEAALLCRRVPRAGHT